MDLIYDYSTKAKYEIRLFGYYLQSNYSMRIYFYLSFEISKNIYKIMFKNSKMYVKLKYI